MPHSTYDEKGVFMRKIYIICLCLCLVGCRNSEIKESTTKKLDITIGCRADVSAISMSHLAKEILSQKGYVVDVETFTDGELYEALAQNKIQAIVSAWFYKSEYVIYESVKDKVDDLGSNCEQLRRGFVVPRYVDTAEISELTMYRSKFNNVLYYFEEIPLLNELAMEANNLYDLNYDLVELSQQEIDDKLKEAVDEGQWIVFCGYIPHWIFAKYDVRFLADTKNVFGEQQEIHTLVNKDLKTENKEIYDILKGFCLYESELNDLLYEVNKKGTDNLKKTVFAWLIKHPHVASRN